MATAVAELSPLIVSLPVDSPLRNKDASNPVVQMYELFKSDFAVHPIRASEGRGQKPMFKEAAD
eukprot:8262739-Lingulodinium_polyedra.AAC.1